MKKIILLSMTVCTFTMLSACSNIVKKPTTSDNKQNQLAQPEETATYEIHGCRFNIPKSWNKKDGKSDKIKYFYPGKDGSDLMVEYQESDLPINDETALIQFLSGMKQEGSLNNLTEKDGQQIDDDAYGWNMSFDYEGLSYNGAMIIVSVDGGILTLFMSSNNQTFENYRDAFNAVYQSLKYSPRSKNVTAPESESAKTSFAPTDTSDATIETISTYGDYLRMLQKIVGEYLLNCDNTFKGTSLESLMTEQKNQQAATISTQNNLYTDMFDQKLNTAKPDLVSYLKEYRDTLNKTLESMKALIQ